MNEDFEKHLRRQPLREIPSGWREDILREAKSSRHSEFGIRHSSISTVRARLSSLLWPHPRAWAGLAAAWVVIAAVHFATRDSFQPMAKNSEPSSPETLVILQQQQRLLAELVAPTQTKDLDRPKHHTAQPRSDRRLDNTCV